MNGRPASSATTDVSRLYTRRSRSYVGYVQAFGHRQGLRAVLARTGVLRAGQRVLDAGCGTGLSILALAGAMRRGGVRPRLVHAFDLTPAMLERCQATLGSHREGLRAAGMPDAELRQADVLRLNDQLPESWHGYDLIVCASMLEHLPRHLLPAALAALRARLAPGGRILIVITRSGFYPTRWIWRCEGYRRRDVRRALAGAGFTGIEFHRYPAACAWLNLGNHVVTAAADRSGPAAETGPGPWRQSS